MYPGDLRKALPGLTPYLDRAASLAVGDGWFRPLAPDVALAGDDLVLTTRAPGTKLRLPPGRWSAFGSPDRFGGPSEAEIPFPRRHLGHGWRYTWASPTIAFQREGTVVPAWGPHAPATSDPLPLELLVSLGRSCHRRLADGTEIELGETGVTVRGPERDVLVWAEGMPVRRVRGSDVTIDLRQARDMLDSGPTGPDTTAFTAAAEADETTGTRHRYEITPNPPAPGEPGVATVRSTVPLDAGRLVFADGTEAPLHEREPGVWLADLPPRPEGTVVRYRIEAAPGSSAPVVAPARTLQPRPKADRPPARLEHVHDAAPPFAYPTPSTPFLRPPRDTFSYEVREPRVPDWAADAVVYQVLVDRFAGPVAGPEEIGFLAFGGGTVRGLTERLDHVAGLGCDVIWVGPLTAGHMHVPYDATDLFAVDPRLGSPTDVRALCDAAHERGMRVILDAEFSYLGTSHPALGDPATRDWFFWVEKDRPVGWFGNPTFVAVDHSCAEAREHLLEAAGWWLDLGFDGFRVDSAHAASLDFWTDFGHAVRGAKPDAFILAETSHALDGCLRYRGRVDSFTDFELCYSLRDFSAGRTGADQLDAVVSARDTIPSGISAATFFENHDLPRLTSVSGYDRRRLRIAHVALLTLPGTPVLYYGTEVGLTQPGPGDIAVASRAPMPWGEAQDRRLYEEVAELVDMRKRSPALRWGARRTLVCRDGVFAFVREHGDETVMVALNASGEEQELVVEGDRMRIGPLEAMIVT